MTNNGDSIDNYLREMAELSEPSLSALEIAARPLVLSGVVGSSYTRIVSGLQYHLCGEMDTHALAMLAEITERDIVLDECCFIGGSAFQLALEFGCQVVGVDIMDSAIAIANRLAQLSGMTHRLQFRIGDAQSLPFPGEHFSVVWNQVSLAHDVAWIDELDRVLQPNGRMALTLQVVTKDRDMNNPFGGIWSLQDLTHILGQRGYEIIDCADLTERDATIGWGSLIRKLDSEHFSYVSQFGEEWVVDARQSFETEAQKMLARDWGNGRIVARKKP